MLPALDAVLDALNPEARESPRAALEALEARGLWPWRVDDPKAPRWVCKVRKFETEVNRSGLRVAAHLKSKETLEATFSLAQLHTLGWVRFSEARRRAYFCDHFAARGATWPETVEEVAHVAALGVESLRVVSSAYLGLCDASQRPHATFQFHIAPRVHLVELHTNRANSMRGFSEIHRIDTAFSIAMERYRVQLTFEWVEDAWPEACPWTSPRIQKAWPALRALWQHKVHLTSLTRGAIQLCVPEDFEELPAPRSTQ